jgi:hypothetical protein
MILSCGNFEETWWHPLLHPLNHQHLSFAIHLQTVYYPCAKSGVAIYTVYGSRDATYDSSLLTDSLCAYDAPRGLRGLGK